jgi:16S rRNA (cytosine967-C5)-methyltransferase
MRRDPDIRWRRSESDLAALADAQLAMLVEAGQAVRPGGRVVYATCSSEPEENEEVVERFLAARPDFSRAPADSIPGPARPFVDERGDFRTRPFRDHLEAFFAAMLVKTKDLR